MRLIIGLGNPGEEYENTRHNVGFEVVDAIVRKEDAPFSAKASKGKGFSFEKKFNAEVAKTRLDGKPVVLAKPHTFVNKSGEAVRKLKLFYKTKPTDVVVVHDDLDIEFGNFKLSFGKDSAGHRGVQSIIDALKTNKFWRLRIGTANSKLTSARRQRTLKQKKEFPTRGTSRGSSISQGEIGTVGNFVLSRFTPTEQAELKKVIKKAIEKLLESLH